MRKGLSARTKISVFFLVVSSLIQIIFLYYMAYKSSTLKYGSYIEIWSHFMEMFAVEMYMIAGSAASAFIFVNLFISQTKGKMGEMVSYVLFLIGISVFENWDTIQSVIKARAISSTDGNLLILNVVIPMIILLSILTSCKPLAVISAIGALLSMVYNLQVVAELRLFVDHAPQIIQISEIFYGVGLFFGLIGIEKNVISDNEKKEVT